MPLYIATAPLVGMSLVYLKYTVYVFPSSNSLKMYSTLSPCVLTVQLFVSAILFTSIKFLPLTLTGILYPYGSYSVISVPYSN